MHVWNVREPGYKSDLNVMRIWWQCGKKTEYEMKFPGRPVQDLETISIKQELNLVSQKLSDAQLERNVRYSWLDFKSGYMGSVPHSFSNIMMTVLCVQDIMAQHSSSSWHTCSTWTTISLIHCTSFFF